MTSLSRSSDTINFSEEPYHSADSLFKGIDSNTVAKSLVKQASPFGAHQLAETEWAWVEMESRSTLRTVIGEIEKRNQNRHVCEVDGKVKSDNNET